jgi:prolyl-tRNA editing enzyme YbaK/EbsC (Cys-tRNA(Pro) deacylase)
MLAEDGSVIEARVHERLRILGVEHEIIECDPDFADTAAFCAKYGVPPEQSANTIVVAARKDPGVACACLVLATCRLDVNHAVCDLLGVRKASFASADQTREITGMMIGGVTPFGLPEGLPIYVDALVMRQPAVVIGGGSRSLKIRLAPSALLRIPGTEVVEGLAHPGGQTLQPADGA